MATINQLSAVDAVVASDQVPLYSSSQGDARKASFTTIVEFLASAFSTLRASSTSQRTQPRLPACLLLQRLARVQGRL